MRRSLQKGVVLLLLLLVTAMSLEQDMAVPISTQYPLFLKILTYDRNIEARAPDEIVIGVVYQSRFRESNSAKDEFLRVAASFPIRPEVNGIPVRCVPIEIGDGDDLALSMQKHGVNVLYVTPLRKLDISTIAATSQAQQAITLTGVPEYVEAGLAVGIALKNDRKPGIFINLPASKAEGAQFSAPLLKVATVIRKGGAE